jgi:hypothetical protein
MKNKDYLIEYTTKRTNASPQEKMLTVRLLNVSRDYLEGYIDCLKSRKKVIQVYYNTIE